MKRAQGVTLYSGDVAPSGRVGILRLGTSFSGSLARPTAVWHLASFIWHLFSPAKVAKHSALRALGGIFYSPAKNAKVAKRGFLALFAPLAGYFFRAKNAKAAKHSALRALGGIFFSREYQP
jgi:hypothetical protein